MTNLRLQTEMYDDIDFCPFCGRQLVRAEYMTDEAKNCPGTFHILVIKGEHTEVM